MTRPIAFLTWCGGLALLASVLAFGSAPASADSFGFSFHSGPAYYHHPHYWHPHYWRPGPRVVFLAPPPVVYGPPPAVVYTPNAPLNAYPASQPYRTADGRYCREYQATVMVNGAPQQSFGTACLQPDGSWHIVN
jgi:hypothetical protein